MSAATLQSKGVGKAHRNIKATSLRAWLGSYDEKLQEGAATAAVHHSICRPHASAAFAAAPATHCTLLTHLSSRATAGA
jgi:hypothetical protein